MKVRFGLVLATAVLMSGAGCATGGAGGATGGAPAARGIQPRDNSYTNSAELYLTQAQTTEDTTEQQQFYQQALQAAQEGITANPQNAQSYFQAARAYVGLNDFAGADSMFAKAEDIYPPYVLETEPYREQGWVNAYNAAITPTEQGDLQKAAELFEMANRLYGQRPEAYLQLGSIYAQLGDYEKSIDAYGSARDILEASKTEELADTAEAGIWNQHWSIANKGLGQAYMLDGQYQAAADLYGQILETNPGDAEVIGSLASVLTELNQPDSVAALYDKLLSRPDLTELDYFNAGVGLYQIEDYEQAAQAFQTAVEMDPMNRDARLNLAQTYFEAEDWEDLVPAARSLLEVDPLNQQVWLMLVRGLNNLGETEQANEAFHEYEQLGMNIQDIRVNGMAGGGATISGVLQNTGAEPGSTVTLVFHLGNENGQEIGTVEIPVQVPEVDQTQSFSGTFNSSQIVQGYRYEVIR